MENGRREETAWAEVDREEEGAEQMEGEGRKGEEMEVGGLWWWTCGTHLDHQSSRSSGEAWYTATHTTSQRCQAGRQEESCIPLRAFPFEDISVSMLLAEAASFHSSQHTDAHAHAGQGRGGKGGKGKQQREACVGRQNKQRRKGGAAGDESVKTGEVEEGAMEGGEGAEKGGKKGGCDAGAGCGGDEGTCHLSPPSPSHPCFSLPCNSVVCPLSPPYLPLVVSPSRCCAGHQSTEAMSAPQLLEALDLWGRCGLWWGVGGFLRHHLSAPSGGALQGAATEETALWQASQPVMPCHVARLGSCGRLPALFPSDKHTWVVPSRASSPPFPSVKAIDAALAGRHAIIATATASGKSLCYNVPVLHTLLSHPHATALYLFPLRLNSQGKSLCYNVPVLHTLLSHPHATAFYFFPTKPYSPTSLPPLPTLPPPKGHPALLSHLAPSTPLASSSQGPSSPPLPPRFLHSPRFLLLRAIQPSSPTSLPPLPTLPPPKGHPALLSHLASSTPHASSSQGPSSPTLPPRFLHSPRFLLPRAIQPYSPTSLPPLPSLPPPKGHLALLSHLASSTPHASSS
ncbi:unnamed protein product [Closterium sp. Naga37s-1]|nr:unnamed protein product [Closterium sp. Naga37s-1]